MKWLSLILFSMAIPCIAHAQNDKVVFAHSSQGFLYAPIYIADSAGFFKEERIQPEIIIFKGGAAGLAGVLSGGAHIQVNDPLAAIKAREQGAPARIFGVLLDQYASNVVVQGDIAKSAGLTEESPMAARLAVLKGLRMGITGPGGTPDQLIRFIGKQAGLVPDRDLTIVPIGAAGMLAAFGQKRIDGFALSSPTSDLAISEHGGFMLINLSKGQYDPLKGQPSQVLVAREDWLKNKSDIATRTLRAIGKGLRMLKENPEQASKVLRSSFPNASDAVYEQAFKSNLPAYVSSLRINEDGISQIFSFIEANEGARPKIDPSTVYTNDIVDAAEKTVK